MSVIAQLLPKLPGAVALMDIADLKRRNVYLGWQRVDQDIGSMDWLCGSVLPPEIGSCRIAGDKWLLAGRISTAALGALIESFATRQTTRVSLVSRARHPGRVSEERRDSVPLDMERSLRCVLDVTPRGELSELLTARERLHREIPFAPVGTVSLLGSYPSDGSSESARWRCCPDPLWDRACQLCGGSQLEITGGAEDVTEGRCLRCGADVTFLVEPG